MQVFGGAEAFDGGHLIASRGDGEGKAGVDATAVQEHGTGTALAVVAAFFTAGEVQLLT